MSQYTVRERYTQARLLTWKNPLTQECKKKTTVTASGQNKMPNLI